MGTRWNRLIEAALTCTRNICFEKKHETKNNQPKIVVFSAMKYCCILHGRVFVTAVEPSNIKLAAGCQLPVADSNRQPATGCRLPIRESATGN